MPPSHTTRIPIVLPGHAYEVEVGFGLAARLAETLRRVVPGVTRVVMITDEKIAPLHGTMIANALTAAGIAVVARTLPAAEEQKRLATLVPLIEPLLTGDGDGGIDRKTPVIAVGGGITLDMAGFLAAILLRGLALVQVPTTLLAMVDASVGGKTGVNADAGKNLIGAFHQPVHVAADVDLLRTLPVGQIIEGLAECIKHAAIADWDRLRWLRENLRSIQGFHTETLAELVAWNVKIKAAVVEADPLEKGVRAHLNFGHTFAHAIESVSGHRYSHGQAVGLGLAAAAHLSHRFGGGGGLTYDQSREIIDLAHEAGLPTTGLSFAVKDLMAAMRHDKKTEHGTLRLVMLRGPGMPMVRSDVAEALVAEAWQSIGAG